MIKHKKNEIAIKSYQPKEAVLNYFEDNVTFLKDKKNLEEAGGEFKDSEDLKRRDASLRKRKVEMLNDHIFPSMANLVVFFEYLAKYPEIKNQFEDDVKELFGYVREPYDQTKETGMDYLKRINILVRFLESVFTWDRKGDQNNFRIMLLHEVQQIITDTFFDLVKTDKSLKTMLSTVIKPDIMRTLAWTRMYAYRYLASNAERDIDEVPHRPVAF